MGDKEITIVKGNTAIFDVQINDSSIGSALNLGSPNPLFDLRLSVRNDPNSNGSAIIGPIAGSITNASAGSAAFYFKPTETGSLVNNAYYDVQVSGTGSVFTPICDRFNIVWNVTRI